MEGAAGIAEAVLASREFPEVLRSLRHNIVIKLEDDAPGRLGVNGNVKLRVV